MWYRTWRRCTYDVPVPWTFYRYVLKDLLKLLLLSTAVLVTVVSFAAAVRPLQEGILGPALLVRFVGYMIPTMLGYVLPLTAAFASTLLFLRLASDNEILACSASGMSYRRVLLPVLVLGLVLTMVMWYLSNFVVPGFFKAAKDTAQRDVVTLLMSRLSKGQAYTQGDFVLYADQAEEVDEIDALGWATPPERLLRLEGVALAELDDQGRVVTEMTAATAEAPVFRVEDTGDLWIAIELSDVTLLDDQGRLVSQRRFSHTPRRLPVRFIDNLKFFSLSDLNALNEKPEGYSAVRRFRRQLEQELAVTSMRQAVRGATESAGRFELVIREANGQVRERFEVQAPPARAERGARGTLVMRADAAGPVQITRYRPGPTGERAELRWEAQTVWLEMESTVEAVEPEMKLTMADVLVYTPDGRAVPTEFDVLEIPRLSWPEPLLVAQDEALSLDELRVLAGSEAMDTMRVRAAARGLDTQLLRLAETVEGQKHQRAASAVSCALVLFVGTLLAMKRKAAMPLAVYFWSFLLAIATVLIANAGENLTGNGEDPLWFGLSVMWSGNLLLFGLGCWLYARVAKN